MPNAVDQSSLELRTLKQIKVRRYQELRRIRARLGEIHKKMLGLIDQMEAMRREEMTPPERSAARGRVDSRKRNKG